MIGPFIRRSWRRQFDVQAEQRASEFAAELELSREQFEEAIRQYDLGRTDHVQEFEHAVTRTPARNIGKKEIVTIKDPEPNKTRLIAIECNDMNRWSAKSWQDEKNHYWEMEPDLDKLYMEIHNKPQPRWSNTRL